MILRFHPSSVRVGYSGPRREPLYWSFVTYTESRRAGDKTGNDASNMPRRDDFAAEEVFAVERFGAPTRKTFSPRKGLLARPTQTLPVFSNRYLSRPRLWDMTFSVPSHGAGNINPFQNHLARRQMQTCP
ncbi:hypothetical protein Bbelb_331810 [Branchiostoma belcheri]|nr:hypothetical protein Bbelb_331810 [Branchiostoma belcheri]